MAKYHESDFFNNKFFCSKFFTAPFFSQPFWTGIHSHCATDTQKASFVEAHTIADHQILVTYSKIIRDHDGRNYIVKVDGNSEAVESAVYLGSDHKKIIVTLKNYALTAGKTVTISHVGTALMTPYNDEAVTNNATVGTNPAPPPPKASRRATKSTK